MDSRQAKDFLVSQTAQQAALEGVPLSDLEKRMMYFTEGADAVEDPIQLNEEFESKYGEDEDYDYEKKMSRLLHRSYSRLRKENPQTVREWDECLQTLRQGDHYILVLCGAQPIQTFRDRPPGDRLKLIAVTFLVVGVLLSLICLYSELASRYPFLNKPGSKTQSFMPPWLKHAALGVMAGCYLFYLLGPLIERRLRGL